MQNNIELYELKYDKDNIQIIGREKISMSMLISDLDKWHKELTDIILLPNNLYYFATNNFDSDTYLEELTNENFEGVKSALEVIIKHPETFFEEYKQKSENYLSVENAQSYKELEKVTQLCGLKISNYSGMDLEKAKLKIQSKLCSDYCFGVFGEILFYAVAENLLCNKLVISKVELITAPNTNAHVSDGVFCDDINIILYFGEAKFTVDLDLGISQALSSMEHCIDRIKIDKDFMLVHQKDMKNGYGHIIRRDNINEYECRILIFLLHGVEIDNDIIIAKLDKAKKKFSKKINKLTFIIASFPIFDKENLKKCIAKGVDDYDK